MNTHSSECFTLNEKLFRKFIHATDSKPMMMLTFHYLHMRNNSFLPRMDADDQDDVYGTWTCNYVNPMTCYITFIHSFICLYNIKCKHTEKKTAYTTRKFIATLYLSMQSHKKVLNKISWNQTKKKTRTKYNKMNITWTNHGASAQWAERWEL